MGEAYILYDNGTKKYRLGQSPCFLGRDPEACELYFDDQELSRKHALIVSSSGHYLIFDFRSTNGVIKNDKVVEQATLKDGDIIRIGRQEIRFVQKEDPIEEKPAPEARPAKRAGELTQILQLGADQVLREAASAGAGAEAAAAEQADLAPKLANLIKVTRIINQDLNRVINGELPLRALLNKIVELALGVIKADRGLVMLRNERTGELIAAAHHDMEHMVSGRPHVISQSIVKHTLLSGDPVLTEDALLDQRFSLSASIQMYNIRSAMCVPLKSRSRMLGVVYIDNRIESYCFERDDLELLTAFADQVAGAIDNAQLVHGIRDETRKRDNLSRFLSPGVVQKIVEHKGELELGGEKVGVTILFADIRGFTSFSEKKEPAVVVKFLNEFFSRMTQVIFEKNGTLDKYLGDGLMAIFGAPVPIPEAPLRAIETAILMQRVMIQNKERWAREYDFTGMLGIGINTGEVISGYMGSAQRMDYTVIGDGVNLAARLQGLSRTGDIVVSDSTFQAIRDRGLTIQELGPVPLKGKSEEVLVYSVKPE